MTYTDKLQELATNLQNLIATGGPEVNSKHIDLLHNIEGILNIGGGSGGGSATIDPEDVTTGVDASTLISGITTKLPSSIGQKVKTGSFPVTIASDQNALPITDNSGSLTVDSPIGTPLFVRLSNGASAIDTVPITDIPKTIVCVTGVANSIGDNTIITAPGIGLKIVITAIRIQNESTTATTIIIKNNSTNLSRVLCTNQGDGFDKTYTIGRELRLVTNTALILNLSGANNIGYSMEYFIE